MLAAALLAGFVLLAVAVEARLLTAVDAAVQPLHGTPDTVGASIFTGVTALGDAWTVVLVTAVAATIALLRKSPADAALLLIAAASARALTMILKLGFERARPLAADPIGLEASFAFPSGHASAAAALYGAVALLVLRSVLPLPVRVATIMLMGAMIFAVASSRIYLGVHHLTDVLGGLLLGFACLAGSAALIEAARRRRPVRAKPAK